MPTPLRLLLLEDNPADAELELHALRRANFEPTSERVETEQEFRRQMMSMPDIILADFTMPQFDSLTALRILRESTLDIPFVIVSGTIGEERAVQAIQYGAADYVMKDRLGRLGQAVKQALEQKRLRREKRAATSLLAAQHAATKVLAESPTLAVAASQILRGICQSLDWDFGALWQVDGAANVLRCVDCWRNPLAKGTDFEDMTREQTFAPDRGLLGRIWASGKAIWVADVSQDVDCPRGPSAARLGLHGVFGFPIVLGTETVGVLEFFNEEIQQPDDEALKMMLAIGSQLGQFIERKRAEQALRESNQMLQALIHAAPVAIVTTDRCSQVAIWNAAAEKIFGWRAQDVVGKPLPLVPANQGDSFAITKQAEGNGRKDTSKEMRLFHKNGSLIDVNLWTAPVTDAQGVVVNTMDLFVDVTERKRAEEGKARLLAIVEATPDFVGICDMDHRVLYLNRAGRRMVGYGDDEDLSQTSIYRNHPDWANDVLGDAALPAVLRDGVWSGEMAVLSRDGREIPVSQVIISHPGPDGNIQFMSTVCRDLTDRKSLEEKVRHSQKMEAVGRLAAGVAHDFNNLLTIIIGYCELLLGKLPPVDPSRPSIGEIRKAGERAASLTRQLLAFGRKQILAPVVLDLNVLMREMEKMLRRLIGEDIELSTVLPLSLGLVKADPGQVEQIIMNLVINARDAMPMGGKLTIETANTVLSESRANAEVSPGLYSLLSVTDTGCGMEESTKAHIFEPFFTTKEVGKGTGLGLATVFGIVKQSGGFIEVDSTPGKGSTFRIYLPRIQETTLTNGLLHSATTMPMGTETVLVVEDEEGVLDLARRILEATGYQVLCTRNADEALERCQQHAGPIHVLVTDVVMPRMSGRQLADLVIPLRPQVKVLYMSGYTNDTIVRHGIMGGTRFLPKPFTPLGLAQKVRNLLDEESHNGDARRK